MTALNPPLIDAVKSGIFSAGRDTIRAESVVKCSNTKAGT